MSQHPDQLIDAPAEPATVALVALAPTLSVDLRRLSAACGADCQELVRAAFALLLARLSGEVDEQRDEPSFTEWVKRPRGRQDGSGEGDSLWVATSEQDANITVELSARSPIGVDGAGLLLDQLSWLLAQLAEQPDAPVGAHSLVTPGTAARLPDPAAPIARRRFRPVTDTFFDCADHYPDHPAVCASGRSWTYAALAQRVRSLASQLRAAGLDSTDVVAVTGWRDLDVIVAVLAVLAAPCVLLTLDPALPRERRRAMLAHAGARAILATGDDGEHTWLADMHLPVSRVGGDIHVGPPPVRRTNLDRAGNDAAYIFFTSGSTGEPKAVLGSHNGLAHFIDWQRRNFDIGPADRFAQLTGLSFDVVLRDALTPLTSGASLHLPGEMEDAASGGTLAWLEREAITLLHTVPSLASAWLSQADPSITLHALRWVFFAGEPLTDNLVGRWRQAFPSSGRIANFYGPTETTLAKCCFLVPDLAPPGVQPIGSPLPGAQALVVGPGDRLCGVGEPGEILIRTPYRSHGYLDNAREQRARFGTNTATDDADDVVYRTGDRGRYRADGSLDILGRVDDEVKIRGVRVSPAEVAAAIVRHEQVREAVVVGERDGRGEALLAAYVVALDAVSFSIASLRARLSATLPSAFVPSRFTVLDRLPLGANGKVDRGALPRHDDQRVTTGGEPASDLQRDVAEEWRRALDVAASGLDDDFFALGGHSLVAAQLLARIRARFGVQLPLRVIFERPTIRQLAATIAELAVATPPEGTTSEPGEQIPVTIEGNECSTRS